MADPIRRALTRRRMMRGRWVVEEPNDKLVLGVKFTLAMTGLMCVLELAHMVVFGAWNSEVFASIAGLSGTVVGLFVGQKT